MFRTASLFVNLSHSIAEYSMLLLALGSAAFAVLWLQRLYTINPDTVYKMAMRRLNSDPVRAYIPFLFLDAHRVNSCHTFVCTAGCA